MNGIILSCLLNDIIVEIQTKVDLKHLAAFMAVPEVLVLLMAPLVSIYQRFGIEERKNVDNL